MKVELYISEDMVWKETVTGVDFLIAELKELRDFYDSELKVAYLTQEDKREIRRDIRAITAVLRMYGT